MAINSRLQKMLCLKLARKHRSKQASFLPAAKRLGHAELRVEKKETYGFLAIVASMFGDFHYFQLITVDTINFPLIFITSINYPLFPLIFEFFNSFFDFPPFSRKIYKKDDRIENGG